MASSVVLVALGAAWCHSVSSFVQTAFLAHVHCNVLLVRFKASGLQHTINIGTPRNSPDILLSPQSCRPSGHGSAGQYFHALQQVIDGVDAGVHQLKALDVYVGGCWAGQFGLLGLLPSGEGWDHLSQLRGTSSPIRGMT